MRKLELIKDGVVDIADTTDGDFFNGMLVREIYAIIHQERPLPLRLTIAVDLSKNRTTKNSTAKERFYDFLEVKERLKVIGFESGKLAAILNKLISVNKMDSLKLRLILEKSKQNIENIIEYDVRITLNSGAILLRVIGQGR